MLVKSGLPFLLILFNILGILASDNNLYMSAENFFKDEKNNFIRAKGNVEIKKDATFIHADSLIYDIEKKEILLEGNVKILTETPKLVITPSFSSSFNLAFLEKSTSPVPVNIFTLPSKSISFF